MLKRLFGLNLENLVGFNLEKFLKENEGENLIHALKERVPKIKDIEQLQELNLQYQKYTIADENESITLKYISYVSPPIFNTPLRYLNDKNIIKGRVPPHAMYLGIRGIKEIEPKKETRLFFKNEKVLVEIDFYLKK